MVETVLLSFLCKVFPLIAPLAGIDMTFYNLYEELKDSDRDKAMEYAEVFLSSADSIFTPPHRIVADVAAELSDYYENEKFLFSSAMKWRLFSLDVYERLGAKDEAAYAEARVATLSYKRRECHTALKYAVSALKFFEENGDAGNALDMYNLLGAVYYMCEDNENAYRYMKLYESAAWELNDSLAMILALNNLAVYDSDTDSLKASYLLQEAIRICKKAGDNEKLCRLYLNAAGMCASHGDYEGADGFLENARPLLPDILLSGQFYYNKANLLLLRGDYQAAADTLQSALEYYGQGELDMYRQLCYLLSKDIYMALSDTANAYAALSAYYDIDSRVNSKANIIQLFKYQSDILLRQEREKQLRRQSTVTLAASASIIVLLTVVFVFYARQKKTREIIRQKNNELSDVNETLEMERMQQYNMSCIAKEISGKLYAINKDISDSALRSKILTMCSELEGQDSDTRWNELNKYVPELNSDMLKKLLKHYPNLTVNERRLCAFLNMNLTTKEISAITRQSVQSINTARTRLRRKLGLKGGGISIQEFISRL